MILPNVNGYNQLEFKNTFLSTELYQRLSTDFDQIVFDKLWTLPPYYFNRTSRQFFGTKHTTRFSAVAFYYLQYITELSPDKIYDLGCGWNVFKKYIPNIIGVSPETNPEHYFGDIFDFVDKDYIDDHQNFFEAVISICALHFVPLSSIGSRVQDFYSMIKPGGRGFLTLNVKRMLELEHKDFTNNVPESDSIHDNTAQPRPWLENYIRSEIGKLDINFLVVDIDLSIIDEMMDGNVRLVMQK